MDKQADTPWRLTLEDRRRRRGWRLCRLPGLWRRNDPARERRQGGHGSAGASLSKAGVRGGGRILAQHLPPSGIQPSHQYNANAELHFVGGDPQSAGFCDGPGPGMALEQNPFLPPTRPGGANEKRCINDPTEQLNITSRCITRSLQYVGTGLNG